MKVAGGEIHVKWDRSDLDLDGTLDFEVPAGKEGKARKADIRWYAGWEMVKMGLELMFSPMRTAVSRDGTTHVSRGAEGEKRSEQVWET